MDLTQLTSSDLQKISKLLEQKEHLQSLISEIDQKLSGFGRNGEEVEAPASKPGRKSGGASAYSAGPAQPAKIKPARKGQKAGRGELKERVVSKLKQSGKEGASVGELAKDLGTTYGNIYAFFQSTAKRIKEIKKVAPGRFAWAG